MTKRSALPWIALFAALVAAAALALLVQRSVRSPTPSPLPALEQPSARLVLAPCKLGDGIYMIGHLSPAAVYVIETSDGLALIDSGMETEYEKIATSIADWGLDLKRLKLILLTHVHGDHSMGAARLRRETGAKILIGREDARPLREGGPWEAIYSRFDMPDASTHPTLVDGELVDGQKLTLGDARITVVATPGHTLGSVCYLVEHRGARILFAGDTVMSLADGLGTYSTHLAPRFRGDASSYLASLRKLRELPTPDMVLPGHPESDPLPQDPRLSQRQWQRLLDRGIDELERLAENFARDGADFLDGNPKQIAEGLFYLGDMAGRSVYAFLSGEATFLFDAAGDDDAPRFLSAAWQKLGVDPPPVAAVLLTSCRPDNTAGLAALVKAFDCRVVASPTVAGELGQHLPNDSVLTSDELASLEWDGLAGISTPGIDPSAVGYHFTIGEDRVLVTGDLPIELTEAQQRQMLGDGTSHGWNLPEVEASLAGIESVRPKVWLSAHPLYGRNANLYDSDWFDALARNRKLLRQVKRQRR